MVATSRMRHRRDFQAAQQGVKVAGKYVVLHHKTLINQGDSADPVVGYVVSKKVGNAVVRNRVRRRLKAAAELVMPNLARQDCDYVVIGRRQSLKRPFPALVQDLEQAIRKVRAERADNRQPASPPSTIDHANVGH